MVWQQYTLAVLAVLNVGASLSQLTASKPGERGRIVEGIVGSLFTLALVVTI
jgi:hypothetical protein